MHRRCADSVSAAASAILSVALLASLAAGCASSGGTARAGTAGEGEGAPAGLCADGCRLQVENRLSDTRLRISVSRIEGVDVLGVVEANSIGEFEVTGEDFEGGLLQVWVRDRRTSELIDMDRIRSFPGGVGHMVVDSR